MSIIPSHFQYHRQSLVMATFLIVVAIAGKVITGLSVLSQSPSTT
ncbi:hypothetical protein [Nostoc sp. CENA543]|nr:hypothetical protein [Nostoc sp. CENA543]